MLEALLGLRDLFFDLADHLLQDVATVLLSFVDARFKLVEIGTQDFLHFRFDFGKASASLADASNDADEFCAGAFALNGFGAAFVFVQDFR